MLDDITLYGLTNTGTAELSQAHLFPRGRQGRSLRGLGPAGTLRRRAPSSVQITALIRGAWAAGTGSARGPTPHRFKSCATCVAAGESHKSPRRVTYGMSRSTIAVGPLYHPRPMQAFNLQVSFRTSDGGATWLFNINTTVAGFLRAVSFESVDTAIVVGDFVTGITPTFGARVLKTTDGGAGWVWQNLFARPFYPVYLYGVSYVDPFTTTAVGRIYLGTRWEGLIIRTINGGANWVSQPSNTSDLLSGVSFVDADHGIAVGEAGTILRTSDGGATWTSPSIGTKAGLYAVSFVTSPCAPN